MRIKRDKHKQLYHVENAITAFSRSCSTTIFDIARTTTASTASMRSAFQTIKFCNSNPTSRSKIRSLATRVRPDLLCTIIEVSGAKYPLLLLQSKQKETRQHENYPQKSSIAVREWVNVGRILGKRSILNIQPSSWIHSQDFCTC